MLMYNNFSLSQRKNMRYGLEDLSQESGQEEAVNPEAQDADALEISQSAPPVSNGVDDIHFDELIDVDELQKQLKKQIEQSKLGIEEPEDDAESEEKSLPATTKETRPARASKKDNSNAKKYVVYIENENIDYIENLSPDERRDIINKILKDKNTSDIKNNELEERKQYTINLVLAVITFIICFPILFIIVNKATEATIVNYYQAKENFAKLYKEQGKIKPNE